LEIADETNHETDPREGSTVGRKDGVTVTYRDAEKPIKFNGTSGKSLKATHSSSLLSYSDPADSASQFE
jgi:hypothetical protein